MKTISVESLNGLYKENNDTCLLDVRSGAEYRSSHVDFARNLPLDTIDSNTAREATINANEIYIICKSGARSKMACEKLSALGFDKLNSVEGGTDAWDAAGLPLIKGTSAISIERQVRIGAGTLVAIGVILSLSVHSAFIGIPAFVGAGLIFAGVTDTCTMGMILSKMPWNK